MIDTITKKNINLSWANGSNERVIWLVKKEYDLVILGVGLRISDY